MIFDTAKQLGLPAGDAFRAVYLAFLGRHERPARRAGCSPRWTAAFVLGRLRDAAASGAAA